jgi:hypothetical protein
MRKNTLVELVRRWCEVNMPPVRQLDQSAWREITEEKLCKNVNEDGHYAVLVYTLQEAVEEEPSDLLTYKKFNESVGFVYASELPDYDVVENDFHRISELVENYLHELSTLEGRYVVVVNDLDGDIDLFYMEEA